LQGEVFLIKDTFKTKKLKKGSEFRLQIPCQKHKLKPIFTDYIYRIISSKKQKDKPYQMDLPYLKTISQIFYQLQKSR